MQMVLTLATIAVGGLGGSIAEAIAHMCDLGSFNELTEAIKPICDVGEAGALGVGYAARYSIEKYCKKLSDTLRNKYKGDPDELFNEWMAIEEAQYEFSESSAKSEKTY